MTRRALVLLAVDAVMRGLDLFEDVDGVYLEPTDILNPSSNGARLGLDNLDDHYTEDYQHVSIVGRVQDCEEVRACVHEAAGPDEIVMISGYCHNSNGAYIWIENLRRRKGRPFERQMTARPGYRDLTPAPEDWAHRAKVDALADEFLKALRSGDRERLLALHFRNAELEWEDDEAQVVRFVLKDRKSPFLDTRKRSELPQRQILVERASLESNDERDSSNYRATICFCREDDCTGRWPIASFDADNLRTRPYVCTTVSPYYVHRKGTVPHFTTGSEDSGLLSPDEIEASRSIRRPCS
jgi:hypothetical protein